MDEEKNPKKHSVIRDIFTQAKNDIVIPKTKELMNSTFSDVVYMIADYCTNVFARLVFGKDAVTSRGRGNNGTNYSSISRRQAQQTVQQNIGVRVSTHLQYVVVDSEEKARQIQSDLVSAIQRYGKVCVADLYEKSEKIVPVFTDYYYGWVNPNDIHFIRNSDGYFFNMPEPIKIK